MDVRPSELPLTREQGFAFKRSDTALNIGKKCAQALELDMYVLSALGWLMG